MARSNMRSAVAAFLMAALIMAPSVARADTNDESWLMVNLMSGRHAPTAKKALVLTWLLVGTAATTAGTIFFQLKASDAASNQQSFLDAHGGAGNLGNTCSTPDACAQYRQYKDDRKSASEASFVFLGLGAAATVVPVVAMSLLWHNETTEKTARILPAVGPGVAGLQFVGRF